MSEFDGIAPLLQRASVALLDVGLMRKAIQGLAFDLEEPVAMSGGDEAYANVHAIYACLDKMETAQTEIEQSIEQLKGVAP